jgi:Sulfotransferase domain
VTAGQAADGHAGGAPGGAAGVRIATWSGPRTISTALMRAWENRPDTVVVDEPLYGFYLAGSGVPHPGRDEVLRSMPTGWREILDQLTSAPRPAGRPIYYQKHMTHHLLPEVDRDALRGLRHAFLIRDPRQLLASYARVRSAPVLADLGMEQQAEIFRLFGGPVVDAGDILRQPRRMLQALCDALGVPFDPAMLSWPAGPRDTDGVWARYWYDGVQRSTGFGAYRETAAELPPALESLADRCQPFYDEMFAHRLTP